MPRKKNKECDTQGVTISISKGKSKKITTQDKKEDVKQAKELSRNHLIPTNSYRENVYNKFFNLLSKFNESNLNKYCLDEIQKLSLNIERGIFNYAVSKSTSQEWDYMFKYYYTNKATCLYMNLQPDKYVKNPDLINRLFNKEFTEFELAFLNSEQLYPSRYKELLDTYIEKLVETPELDIQGIFKCGKCKTYKTSYYQMQTRSADEPMTTFVTCHNCNNKWRFC